MAGPLLRENLDRFVELLTPEQAERVIAKLTPDQLRTFQDLMLRTLAARKLAPPSESPAAPAVGPLIGQDDTAWFFVGLRWVPLPTASHMFVVTCNHCGVEVDFESLADGTRKIGEWMINHRRQHR